MLSNMGDLRGYEVELECCACKESFHAHVWRGDRMLQFQLCGSCRIAEYTIERDRFGDQGTWLMKSGRRVRELRS